MTRKRRDKMRPFLRLTSVLTAILLAAASQAENKGLPELTPEELERYQFEIEESEVTVTDLSLGQRYVLSTQRREVADLAARRLGIIKLKGDKSDLSILQNIVEKKLIRQEDVRGWQGLGIVFGDVLAAETPARGTPNAPVQPCRNQCQIFTRAVNWGGKLKLQSARSRLYRR